MITQSKTNFPSVYGPVKSWRYGRSLGIDPIGIISTCSFNCVYCQLGEIERKTLDRDIFIPTTQIIADLQAYAPWDVDIITLSGSGEPTLALNLGEIITQIKKNTDKPVLVLTNGTLLNQQNVRQDLALADQVSVKLDGIDQDQIQRINRPIKEINWAKIWEGIKLFRQEYTGYFGIQTMVLSHWNPITEIQYLDLIKTLKPDEIQLNTPSRPKPIKRQLEGRGNSDPIQSCPYEVQFLKCVEPETIKTLANKIQQQTGINVKCKT